MALKILRVSDDLYSVYATPPDVRQEWSPAEPVRGRHLTRELIERDPWHGVPSLTVMPDTRMFCLLQPVLKRNRRSIVQQNHVDVRVSRLLIAGAEIKRPLLSTGDPIEGCAG